MTCVYCDNEAEYISAGIAYCQDCAEQEAKLIGEFVGVTIDSGVPVDFIFDIERLEGIYAKV